MDQKLLSVWKQKRVMKQWLECESRDKCGCAQILSEKVNSDDVNNCIVIAIDSFKLPC